MARLTFLLTRDLMKGLMMHIIGQEEQHYLDDYNALEGPLTVVMGITVYRCLLF